MLIYSLEIHKKINTMIIRFLFILFIAFLIANVGLRTVRTTFKNSIKKGVITRLSTTEDVSDKDMDMLFTGDEYVQVRLDDGTEISAIKQKSVAKNVGDSASAGRWFVNGSYIIY